VTTKTILYVCQNCETKFELPEIQTPRCPNCFWTTSIRRADQAVPRAQLNAKSKKQFVSPQLIKILVTVVFIVVLAWLSSRLLKYIPKTFGKTISKRKTVSVPTPDSQKATAKDFLNFLSPEEKKALETWIPFAIPRMLSGDELQMLSKRADFSASASTLPQLNFWTTDSFEKFLTAEQTKRKIYFPGSYESTLKKLFASHYLKVEQILKNGNLAEARIELLNALVFPIYGHNVRLHKSVALVMLQNYINDVLKKIQVLNSYLAAQGLSALMNDLQKDYAEIFQLIDGKDWAGALKLVEKSESEAKTIDAETKEAHVNYPPFISQIDSDIQKGLELQDQALTPLASGLKSLLADLRIKKKVLEQNTDDALRLMKKNYDFAALAIRDQKWQDAKDALEPIIFPADISEDTKQKILILVKIIDHSNVGGTAGEKKTN